MQRLPNSSYYTSIDPPFAAQPPLEGDQQCDVCVIGGGFTGLAAALACAEKGMRVILIEADRIGHGASGRNGGQMIPGLNSYGADLEASYGRETARDLYRLAASARDRVHRRIVRHSIDCDLRHGHVHLAAKREHFDAFRREADFANDLLGAGSAILVPPDSIADHVAVAGYYGAILTPAGGHMHPMKYLYGLAAAARAAGVQICENSRALSVAAGGAAVIETARGRVTAPHAILACDSDMADIAPRIARTTMPVLNYIIATEPLGSARAAALIPSGAAVSDSRFVLNYFRLSADDRMLFAGGEKYSPQPPRDIAAFVRPYMLKLFPSLADAAIDYAWGGTVGITVNRLPHFGRSGPLLYAHGYSGQGVLLATLAGEVMADAIGGDSAEFDRFAAVGHMSFPGGRWLRNPIYMAAMMVSALRDRL